MTKKPKIDPIREAKRAARFIIGEPSQNRKRGPHKVKDRHDYEEGIVSDLIDEEE